MSFTWKIRITFFLALFLMVFWLFFMAVVPGGKISYVYNFQNSSQFILPLTPKERVAEPQNGSQKIVGDPVYFSLRTPRTFDTAKLTIKYKNKSTQPLIEAGVLTDKVVWNYNLQPLENKVIDNLAKTWNMVREGDLVLLQRNKKFNSIADFQKNLPKREEIALYNYDLKYDFVLVDANPELSFGYPELSSGVVGLRGPFQFYTYLKKGEDLKFAFEFFDLNKNKDSDPIDINVYHQDRLILSRHLDDDDDDESARLRPESIQDFGGQGIGNWELGISENLKEGVYKVELKCNDDIITKNIETNNKIAFINRLWLYNNENIKIFTDSHFINAQTINPGSLQKIKAGNSELDLSETYKQFGLKLREKTSDIVIPKNDVILSGDGVFAFSSGNLFNPNIRKIDANFDADQEGVNYILAHYQSPSEVDGWKIAEAEFNLKGIYREFYKYSLMLSIPGLKEGEVEIGEIRVHLRGRGLWEKLRELKVIKFLKL